MQWATSDNLSTRVVGLGESFCDVNCGKAERRCADSVVDKRSSQVRAIGATCRDITAEVAREHGRGGDKFSLVRGSLTGGCTLVARKEKQLVLLDWASDCTAKQVALELVICLCEKIT